MKSRLAGVALVISALLVTGCTPQPEPKPDASSAPSASATPKPSATPTPDIFAEPVSAFDVDCAGIAAEMEQITGAPASSAVERAQTATTSGWVAGPGEFYAQRAAGASCSYTEGDRFWEVIVLPGVPAIVSALELAGYDFPDGASPCDPGYCQLEVVSKDVAVALSTYSPNMDASGPDLLRALAQRIAESASASQRVAEIVASPIAGADCTQVVTPEQIREFTGVEIAVQDSFGGWGYPAHAYFTMGGGQYCAFYEEGGSEYERVTPVTVTTLPAGAWAFDQLEGRTPVEVEGADKAYTGTHAYGEYVDILVDADWVRITTSETVSAPMDVANTVATNLREIDWPGRVR